MKTVIEMARWKQIPSFPEYMVSDCGMVRRNNRLLSHRENANGYLRVQMQRNGKSTARTIHSLVAEAFIGERPEGFHVCHIDGDKTNNSVENLKYATAKENAADKIRHGRVSTGGNNGMNTCPECRPLGSKHGKSVLHENDVIYIKAQLSIGGRGVGERMARVFNVSTSTISCIKKGKAWGWL